jgi:magnesium-transporting ATPase (P-type)
MWVCRWLSYMKFRKLVRLQKLMVLLFYVCVPFYLTSFLLSIYLFLRPNTVEEIVSQPYWLCIQPFVNLIFMMVMVVFLAMKEVFYYAVEEKRERRIRRSVK